MSVSGIEKAQGRAPGRLPGPGEGRHRRLLIYLGAAASFPADDLRDGPFGPVLDALEVMKDLPIFKPLPQFPGFEKKVGIVGSAKPRLVRGVGLIDEDAPCFDGSPYRGNQGPMKVVEDDDPSISTLRKGWRSFDLQIHLPCVDGDADPGGHLLTLVEGFH